MIDIDKIAENLSKPQGRVRTAGKIEFIRDQGPIRRDLRARNFAWSPESLKDLAKILWATQRAHSYAMAAHRLFSKMQSSEFSPDGLLGGKGYIQSIKDMRTNMAQAIEVLSAFADTMHDEVNGEHWANAGSDKATEIVNEAESVRANPEEFVEQQYNEGEEGENFEELSPEEMNPSPQDLGEPESESDESIDSDSDDDDGFVHTSAALSDYDGYLASFDKLLKEQGQIRQASTRIADVEALIFGPEPMIDDSNMGGPRAYPRGPAEGGEFGGFNEEDLDWAENPMKLDEELILDHDLPCGDLDPTQGDVERQAANTYSMLPGADNRKNMNWYGLNITAEDIDWMEKHCEPEIYGKSDKKPLLRDPLWDMVDV